MWNSSSLSQWGKISNFTFSCVLALALLVATVIIPEPTPRVPKPLTDTSKATQIIESGGRGAIHTGEGHIDLGGN